VSPAVNGSFSCHTRYSGRMRRLLLALEVLALVVLLPAPPPAAARPAVSVAAP
jgi:hypothetical protein